MSEPTHTMPDNDEEVQSQVEAVFGFRPCLWQIRVVHAILNGDNVITIAPTGSGKSMTYWMPLLYIKHGISVVVTPLKLLGVQFADMLQDNGISAGPVLATWTLEYGAVFAPQHFGASHRHSCCICCVQCMPEICCSSCRLLYCKVVATRATAKHTHTATAIYASR
jgi:hypothetical protein